MGRFENSIPDFVVWSQAIHRQVRSVWVLYYRLFDLQIIENASESVDNFKTQAYKPKKNKTPIELPPMIAFRAAVVKNGIAEEKHYDFHQGSLILITLNIARNSLLYGLYIN